MTVNDNNSGTNTATVTISITGTDDKPVIATSDKAETSTVTDNLVAGWS